VTIERPIWRGAELIDSPPVDEKTGDHRRWGVTCPPHGQTSLAVAERIESVRQESVLGIGGRRALRALGKKPTVCHMNEGHSAFCGLERIRVLMEENRVDFATAREAVAAGSETRATIEALNKGLSLPPGVDIKIRVLAGTAS